MVFVDSKLVALMGGPAVFFIKIFSNNKIIQIKLFLRRIYKIVIIMGGGSSSGQEEKVFTTSKPGLLLLGSTTKGPIIMSFSPTKIQSSRSTIKFPKYAHAFNNGAGIGYITGGVQQLISTATELKSAEEQEYQGVISKKFIKVRMDKLLINPEQALQNMPDMINARYAHCAVQHQGSVYAIGGREYGDDEVGILSACQKFSLSQQKWKSIPSLQYPRSGASAIIYGDLIYVFGGYTGKNERTRVIQSYIEGDNGWRKLSYRLHQGLQGFLCVSNPTNPASIYVFGGKTNFGKTNSVVEINFDKATVQYCKPMSQDRSFHKGFIRDKVTYIIGGGSDTVQCYEIDLNKSTIDTQLSFLQHCTAKELAALSCLQPQIKLQHKVKPYQSPNYKNKLFIFGHAKQPFTRIIDLDTFVVISQTQNMNHNFYKFPTVAKVNKEISFIMGGINSQLTEVTDAVYSFNVITEQIKYLEPMKSAKYGFSAAVKGSFLYIVGGRKLGGDDIAILSTCERYSFQSYNWQTIAPLKHKRHSALLLTVGNFLVAIGGYKGNGIRSNQIQLYIENQNRWVQVDQRFELAAQSMTPVSYMNQIILFGGKAQQIDIQKVFKLHIEADQSKKIEKCVKTFLEPVGNLSMAGTNLRVYLNKTQGLAYIFGNVKYGIDVYDIKKNKVSTTQNLPVFDYLMDQLFQSYTIVF